VRPLAKHQVAGSTPVTRSQEPPGHGSLHRRRAGLWGIGDREQDRRSPSTTGTSRQDHDGGDHLRPRLL